MKKILIFLGCIIFYGTLILGADSAFNGVVVCAGATSQPHKPTYPITFPTPPNTPCALAIVHVLPALPLDHVTGTLKGDAQSLPATPHDEADQKEMCAHATAAVACTPNHSGRASDGHMPAPSFGHRAIQIPPLNLMLLLNNSGLSLPATNEHGQAGLNPAPSDGHAVQIRFDTASFAPKKGPKANPAKSATLPKPMKGSASSKAGSPVAQKRNVTPVARHARGGHRRYPSQPLPKQYHLAPLVKVVTAANGGNPKKVAAEY